MKKILVVSTKFEFQQDIARMIEQGHIPADEYSFFIESWGSTPDPTQAVFPNVHVIDDLLNEAAIEDGIKKCLLWGPFDLVIAANEYTVLLAARLRERLDVKGPVLADILKFRDKVLMKQSLEGSAVRAPRLYSRLKLESDSTIFPAVAKPRTYAGSEGVRVVHSFQDFVEHFPNADVDYERPFRPDLEFSLNDIEVEEMMHGTVHHIDGIVFNGEILLCLPSLTMMQCIGYVNDRPLASQAVTSPSQRSKWSKFTAKVHEAMRIPDGAFHLEAFHTSAGDFFLEVGVRPAGAYIARAIDRALGIDLDLAHIQCQLGVRPSIPEDLSKGYARLIIPKKLGEISSRKVARVHLPNFSGYVEPNWAYTPEVGSDANASFSSPLSNLGAFTFSGEDGALLGATLHMMMQSYRVEIE